MGPGESPKIAFEFPQYLKRHNVHQEIRIVPQSLMKMLEKPKDEQLKYLVASGLLDAVGYDLVEQTRKITRDSAGKVLKDEETIKKAHQPANQQLLTFFITNIARQLDSNDWVQKVVPLQDNRQITLNIDGKIESDRIAQFAQRFLTGEQKNEVSEVSK